MTFAPFLTLLAPIFGIAVVLIVGHFATRDLRAETARAREAERKAREPAPHAIR